jgi:hypothetical protein
MRTLRVALPAGIFVIFSGLMKYSICRSAVLTAFFAAVGYTQPEADIDAEISMQKKEISRVNSEREKVRGATLHDQKEFGDYQERNRQRQQSLAAETDSVRAVTSAITRRNDSLGAVLQQITAAQREIELTRQHFRECLISLCGKALAAADSLAPSLAAQAVASLTFLKSELTANTIDNLEGLHRLMTVLNDIESQEMDIQIMQGASPVAAITGTCYRIRIGSVFEAVVDSRGGRGAVWTGGGKDNWQVIEDASVAGRLLKAINVREGKTLPALVDLPFEASGPEQGSVDGNNGN